MVVDKDREELGQSLSDEMPLAMVGDLARRMAIANENAGFETELICIPLSLLRRNVPESRLTRAAI